jgi:hypothetical protein
VSDRFCLSDETRCGDVGALVQTNPSILTRASIQPPQPARRVEQLSMLHSSIACIEERQSFDQGREAPIAGLK